MDRDRFDALARLLAATGSRRGTLGAILGVALFGQDPEDGLAKPGKEKKQDRGKGNGRGDGSPQDRLAAEARGKHKNRKNRKRRKQRPDRGPGGDGSSTGDCCGTEGCSRPEPGSTRSECDFAGQSFAGEDLNGSIFRGIDGRGANFNNTDNHGSVFAEACLQGASFRGANLGGSTWGNACLIDADFTGADLGGDSATFGGAVFCQTIMPDGRVDDRDCGALPACCRRQVGAGEACRAAGDCVNVACLTKACQNGTCVYTLQPNGQPGTNCATQCCNGICCAAGTLCANGQCVVNCGGRACGPGETCCGNRCESETCCDLQLGCDPGTCCAPFACIPVSPPNPNLPPSMCQLCCAHDSDCPIANTFCSSDPRFCGTSQCPTGSCCQAVGCQNDNECETHICCGRPSGTCCLLGRECVNNTCVVP